MNQQPTMVSTLDDSFRMLGNLFRPGMARNVQLTVQYQITGRGTGTWNAKIRNGSCEIQQGEMTDADIVISANSQDWIDLVNGRLVDDSNRFSVQLKKPLENDEVPEEVIAWEYAGLLRGLGLLGREFLLPLWAERAGFLGPNELIGFTTKYGELDHGEFLRSGQLVDVNGFEGYRTLAELLFAPKFWRISWPVASMILLRWLSLLLLALTFPLFPMPWWVGVTSFSSGYLLFRLSRGGAKERLQEAMSRDAGFFTYAVEQGVITPAYDGGDKPDFEEAFGMNAYPICAVLFGVALSGLLFVAMLIWLFISSLF